MPLYTKLFTLKIILKSFRFGIAAAVLSLGHAPLIWAKSVDPYIKAVEQTESGMTLWELIQSGGVVMIAIFFLSIAAVALVAYLFMYLKPEIVAPLDFSQDLINKLSTRKYQVVRELCNRNDNAISRIVLAGLDKLDKGPMLARESVEVKAKGEIARMWEKLSYLSDLAAVAPLVGLLGTVVGMIQAFNAIAFQSTVVKPMLLAGGVSKAMVTTAGGLTVAIPVMLFYAFFRSKLGKITVVIESLTSDIQDVLGSTDKRR